MPEGHSIVWINGWHGHSTRDCCKNMCLRGSVPKDAFHAALARHDLTAQVPSDTHQRLDAAARKLPSRVSEWPLRVFAVVASIVILAVLFTSGFYEKVQKWLCI